MKKYDYLIVGAGLFGSIAAYGLTKRGKKCLMIDKRGHIGGNVYCDKEGVIPVHKYGAHIFHTNNKVVWDYVNGFAAFNRYTNCPVANYNGELYNLPFNMNTFYAMWGVRTPAEAKAKIEEGVRAAGITEPKNLEEKAISLVGADIYEKLIKGYTEKQWGRKCSDLPAFIISRLPVRFTFDNNYFNDAYQGIPVGGYNVLFEKWLNGVEVKLNCDFIENRAELKSAADKIIYTGQLDTLYGYKLGRLEYRSLRFDTERLETENYQGNAVINYTDAVTPYTRIIEHKHFDNISCPYTVITREYPETFGEGKEPYYPINDEKNNALYKQYLDLTKKEAKIIPAGRLGDYKYYDMHHVVEKALDFIKVIT